MPLWQHLALGFGAVLAPMVALWLVSLRLRDVSIVDIMWGPAFAIVAWASYAAATAPGDRALWIAVAVTVWGLRLGGYLLWRNAGKDEDRRYQQIRAGYGDRFPLVSLVVVFGFQALLVAVVSLPVQVAIVRGGPEIELVHAVGFGLFAVGLAFETIGDAQLAAFKADPANAGRVMDRGLWRYSRHPNYFGDFVAWWGLFAACWSGVDYAWTAVGPAVMSVLLLKVSGVALLEKDIGERRPGYREYVERTSAFVPLPLRTDR